MLASQDSARLTVTTTHEPVAGLGQRHAGERAFAQGICVGFASVLVLLHVWLAFELTGMRAMYRDFGGEVPAVTRVVISVGWMWGAPVAGALAVAGLLVRRPRATWPFVVVAALLLLSVAGTWHWSQQPLRELAGNIAG